MHDKKSGGLLAGGCLILGAVLALLLSLVMIQIEKELPKEMRPK